MKTINSTVAGAFKQDSTWLDWWINEDVSIPFFSNKKHVLIYINKNWRVEHKLVEKVDNALSQLLELTDLDRKTVSKNVYEYCYQYCARKNNNYCGWLPGKEDIWDYIEPTTICLVQKKNDIDIVVNCECPFLKNNGIQLRYSDGTTLPKISWQEDF